MGKGDTPRPMQISYAERDLRYDLAFGHITERQFKIRMNKLRKAGKLKPVPRGIR